MKTKKQELWSKYFNLNNQVFKQKEYSFDYRISTDCFSVSIQLIHNDFIQKDKKQNMKTKKNEIKELTKDMKQEQKEKYKEDLIKKKKDEQVKLKLEKKLLKGKRSI